MAGLLRQQHGIFEYRFCPFFRFLVVYIYRVDENVFFLEFIFSFLIIRGTLWKTKNWSEHFTQVIYIYYYFINLYLKSIYKRENMGERNYITTVGYISAEYSQIWDDSEKYKWVEFDYDMLLAKVDSNRELLFGLNQSNFSSVNTLRTDVIFAIVSTPLVGLIAKNQTLLAVDIIRGIPWWVFGLASLTACVVRINAIIENNRELLQLNYNGVKFLEFLDGLPRFDEFRETEYFENMLKSDVGVLRLLDFDVVDEFYKFRSQKRIG